MIHNPSQQKLEAKLRALIQGFRTFHPATLQLVIRGERLIPAQVVQRLRGMVESFEAVRDHEEQRKQAVETCNQATPEYRAFYEDAVNVVRAHCGSDARKLAGFGIDSPRRPGPKPRTGSRTCPPEKACAGSEETVEVIEVTEVVTEETEACPKPTRVKPGRTCRKPTRTRAKAKGGRC